MIDTGSEQEYLDSARYALTHGMPGGGYIFCTSNCIYTGMKLDRYVKILDLWRAIGNYGPHVADGEPLTGRSGTDT